MSSSKLILRAFFGVIFALFITSSVWSAQESPESPMKLPGTVRLYTAEDGMPSNDVLRVGFNQDGCVFVEVYDHERFGSMPALLYLKDGKFHSHPHYTRCSGGLAESLSLEDLRRVHPAPPFLWTHGDLYNMAGTMHVTRLGDGSEYWATRHGLYRRPPSGASWSRVFAEDDEGRDWGSRNVRGVAIDAKGRLWFTAPPGVACRTSKGWTFYTKQDGVPSTDSTCAEAGGDDAVWFGTRTGAIRYADGKWTRYSGKKWLPNDHIRDIAVDAAGSAWIAVQGGLVVISFE